MQKRAFRSTAFKKKVALAALKEDATVQEIACRFGIHATQVHKWKRKLIENADVIFESKKNNFEEKEAKLHEQIGKLTVENNWLKKKLGL